ncbi:lipoyl(octanoyl) transferase [Malassezia cuniculi]|uniref:Lipoyl(Octanoyl) transferase n=1 Tax=Malassezia cuniculi TaxID=948313 RepID=A0AAF0EY01_9BASI|nr:lipoyl(octanoyl) transferase [Malassezia cuniculi]
MFATRARMRIEPLVALEREPRSAVGSALALAWMLGSVPVDTAVPLALEGAAFAAAAACDLTSATVRMQALIDATPHTQRADVLHRCVHAVAAVRPATSAFHPAIALATLYDHAIELHIEPTPETISRLVAVLSQSLCQDTLVQVLDALSPHMLNAMQREQPCLGVVTAFIAAYGRAQHPELGEKLLAAASHAAQGPSASASPSPTCLAAAQQQQQHSSAARRYLRAVRASRGNAASGSDMPVDVPLSSWAAYTSVWNALVRARGEAGDYAGARIWLERYRFAISDGACGAGAGTGAVAPRRSASPYLTVMHLCTTRQGMLALQNGGHARALARHARHERRTMQQAAVHELLRAMRRDGVMPGVSVLSFVAMIEAASGHVERAAAILREALVVPHASPDAAPRYRAATGSLLAFLMVHAEHAREHPGVPLYAAAPSGPDAAALAAVATPRAIITTLMKRLRSPTTQKMLHTRGTRLLNEALRAAIYAHDYALGLQVVHLYAKLAVAPDAQTSSYVWESLAHVLQADLADALADAIPTEEASSTIPLLKERRLLERMVALQK